MCKIGLALDHLFMFELKTQINLQINHFLEELLFLNGYF